MKGSRFMKFVGEVNGEFLSFESFFNELYER